MAQFKALILKAGNGQNLSNPVILSTGNDSERQRVHDAFNALVTSSLLSDIEVVEAVVVADARPLTGSEIVPDEDFYQPTP